MQYKVSAILPSLNVAPYIRDCMDSVLGQALKEIEVICVDAGSTDGTWEILEGYAQADPRVVLLKSDEKSYGKQVNMGIKFAHGEYVGIVETDDYVSIDMYGALYPLAKKHSLEAIKADFDRVESVGGRQYFYTEKLFSNKNERGLYGQVLSADDFPARYIRDFYVWKGLYNRKFLVDNQVYFHESPGAAFQDCGFSLLAHSHLKRFMYVEGSLYRYRCDRQDASTWNVNVLRYTYQEYKRILDAEWFRPAHAHWPYVNQRVATGFLWEYNKLLRKFGYQADPAYMGPYFGWFKDVLMEAVGKGQLRQSECDLETWLRLRLLFHSPESYAGYLYMFDTLQEENERELLGLVRDSRLVIFGCGEYGQQAALFYLRRGIHLESFCDNNSSLWGSSVMGREVRSPQACLEHSAEACYLVANSAHADGIRSQLLGMGVVEGQIAVFDSHKYMAATRLKNYYSV